MQKCDYKYLDAAYVRVITIYLNVAAKDSRYAGQYKRMRYNEIIG